MQWVPSSFWIKKKKKNTTQRETDEEDARQPTNSNSVTPKRISWALLPGFNSNNSTVWKQTCCTGFSHLPPFHPSLHALLVIFFSPIYVTPNTLLHPCLASPLTDCLICSLMLSEMQQPFRGSLLWGWTCISLPDRGRKEAKMGVEWREKWGSFMPNRRQV